MVCSNVDAVADVSCFDLETYVMKSLERHSLASINQSTASKMSQWVRSEDVTELEDAYAVAISTIELREKHLRDSMGTCCDILRAIRHSMDGEKPFPAMTKINEAIAKYEEALNL